MNSYINKIIKKYIYIFKVDTSIYLVTMSRLKINKIYWIRI